MSNHMWYVKQSGYCSERSCQIICGMSNSLATAVRDHVKSYVVCQTVWLLQCEIMSNHMWYVKQSGYCSERSCQIICDMSNSLATAVRDHVKSYVICQTV